MGTMKRMGIDMAAGGRDPVIRNLVLTAAGPQDLVNPILRKAAA